MSKRLYCIILMLIITNSFSQKKEFYFGEKYKPIEKKDFEKRLKSNLFTSTTIENDTAKFHKLRFIEFFGSIDSTKNKQLKSQLTFKYPLNPNKTWLIYYIDSLPDVQKMHKEAGTYYIDTIAKDSVFVPRYRHYKKLDREKYNYRRHVSSLKSFQKYLKQWRQKINSNIELFFTYHSNKGFPLDFSPKVKLYKDPNNIIGKVFNDGQVKYRHIMLFPNGDFYVTSIHNWEIKLPLLKRSEYLKEKEKWLDRVAKLEQK